MKKNIGLLFLPLLFCAIMAAPSPVCGQKVQPIQVQTINDSVYVVEYVPASKAQQDIAKQIDATTKQLAQTDVQIKRLTDQHDRLTMQLAALTAAQKQLDKAVDSATPPPQTAPAATTPAVPAPEKPAKPKKTKKKKQ